MKNWSNQQIVDWIKCMNLGAEWNNKISNVIQLNACTGEDIVELKSVDDIGEAFEIAYHKALCNRIFNEIKNFKPILKENHNNEFNINLLIKNRDEQLTLNGEVTKTDTIKTIKTMFKIQKRIDFDIKHIHFRFNKKTLSNNKTLKQYGIVNENHLIEVVLDNVFRIYIYAQEKNLTLNKQVTKHYTIQQIKRMYKKQSGVYAKVNDIKFYKKNDLLRSNRTLEQCGIVDDKHLITVKFDADGGGRDKPFQFPIHFE
eukprot:316918_1